MRSLLLILAVPALLLPGIGSNKSSAKTKLHASARAETSRVASPSQKRWLGIARAAMDVTLSPEQSGLIAELPVELGHSVLKGERLMQLTSRVEALEVERLSALAKSKANTKSAESRLAFAQQEYDRVRRLVEQSVGTEKQLKEARLELQLGKIEAENARTKDLIAEIQWKEARERLLQRSIWSPIDGIVTKILVQKGESVERFQPAMRVLALDPLHVEFQCPVEDAAFFREGMQVRVTREHDPNHPRIGTVTHASVAADPSSHTFSVRIRVPNPKPSWKAGLKVWLEPQD